MKTKKQFIACLTLVALLVAQANFGNLKAQVITKYGVRGSFTLNTLSFSEAAPELSTSSTMQYSYTPAFSAGLFIDFRLNPTITLGAEFLYSQQGAKGIVKIDLPTTSGEYEGNITSQYLQVPLLLKIYPFTGFAFEVGPQFGYCLGGKKEYTYTENLKDWGLTTEEIYTRPRGSFDKIEEDANEYLDGFEYYNRWDVSVTAGISYRFNCGIIIGARYNYGFFDVFNELKLNKKGKYVQEVAESKNSSIAISLGFRF